MAQIMGSRCLRSGWNEQCQLSVHCCIRLHGQNLTLEELQSRYRRVCACCAWHALQVSKCQSVRSQKRTREGRTEKHKLLQAIEQATGILPCWFCSVVLLSVSRRSLQSDKTEACRLLGTGLQERITSC